MKVETVYFDNLEIEITYHIGKSDSDNFQIIDRASPDDIWFHANQVSSCHVIMKMPSNEKFDNKELKTLIKKGALLCKQYTNKLASENKVEIIYTTINNITKTKKIGCVKANNTKTIKV